VTASRPSPCWRPASSMGPPPRSSARWRSIQVPRPPTTCWARSPGGVATGWPPSASTGPRSRSTRARAPTTSSGTWRWPRARMRPRAASMRPTSRSIPTATRRASTWPRSASGRAMPPRPRASTGRRSIIIPRMRAPKPAWREPSGPCAGPASRARAAPERPGRPRLWPPRRACYSGAAENAFERGARMALPESPRAVVTGAGSGLGRALCVVLAQRGARIVASDINLSAARATVALLPGDQAHAVACDVANFEQVQALGEKADQLLGGVDLVVNNAGVAAGGRVGEIPLSDWQWLLGINLWGVIHGCHVFVPRLRRQKSGHILNVASAAGLAGLPQLGPYNVSKAGVIALS